MVSFTFVLCSTLLFSVAIAAPHPDAGSEVAPAASATKEFAAEIDKQAEKSAKKVLEDVASGKDVHESLLDRSIKLTNLILGEVKSIGHSLSKRLSELKRGDSIGEVAGRMWHAFVRKVSGKNKTFDELVHKFGSEHVQKFITGAVNLLKAIIMPSVSKGEPLKEIEGVMDKKAEAELIDMAKELKEKAK